MSKLKPNSKILDVGFGSGRDSLYFKNKGYIVKRTGSWPNPDYQVTFDETLIPPIAPSKFFCIF